MKWHHVFAVSLPFQFIGGLTNNYFEIFPVFIFFLPFVLTRFSIIFAFLALVLSCILITGFIWGEPNAERLLRSYVYLINALCVIGVSFFLTRSDAYEVLSISGLIMGFSVFAGRFIPGAQDLFYSWSRSYGDAAAVLEYSGAVAGIASEPSYAAGFLGSCLLGIKALSVVAREQYIKSQRNRLTEAWIALSVIMCGSLTGLLTLGLVYLGFSLITRKGFFMASGIAFAAVLVWPILIATDLRVISRLLEVSAILVDNYEVLLFDDTITARNSIFKEFYFYPLDGGLIFGADRPIYGSGNFLAETLHIIFSPLDYVFYLAILVCSFFNRTMRVFGVLVALQFFVIQPVLIIQSMIVFSSLFRRLT